MRTETILFLDKPTAMVFAADGTLYVTIIGTSKDGKVKPGELWRISGL